MEPIDLERLRGAGLALPHGTVALLVRGLVVAFLPGMEMPLVLRVTGGDRS